jgi:hypothetical protein
LDILFWLSGRKPETTIAFGESITIVEANEPNQGKVISAESGLIIQPFIQKGRIQKIYLLYPVDPVKKTKK